MKIIFDSKTLRVGQSNLVTAVVYFDFDAVSQFPMNQWNDFVIVIANWWLEELSRLTRIGSNAKFRFMDGPYWFEATISENGNVTLNFVEDRTGFGVVHEACIAFIEFERELLDFANKVFEACAKLDIASTDFDDLKRALSRAK